jgi:RNA polymerase sigma-70 factor (ECF subfamily)
MNLRRKRSKNEVSFGEPSNSEDPSLHWVTADLDFSPEEDCARRELQEILTGVIAELKPSFRMVFRLRYLNQLSTNATAQTLNLPISTVKTRLHRARMELRRVLEKTLGPAQNDRCPVYEHATHYRNLAAGRVRWHREYMSIFSKVNEKVA